MRKILTFLFAALMSASMFALTPLSGDTWDDATKTLTVNGNPESYAYYGESDIENLVISDAVTSIESGAFGYCSGLTSVTIGNSVTSIGGYAFRNCSGLTSITIPNSVTSIGDGAFTKCSGLTSVTIGNSVTSIGNEAFSGCSGLTSIVVASGNTTYDSRENCNAIIEKSTNTLIAGCKNTIIPNSVISIGDWAFYECSGLTSITIPNSVTDIGSYAFQYCSGLTSITIPNSVTSIGDGAFQGCSGLTSVTIGNSVTSIGGYAFQDCSNLETVTNYATTPQNIESKNVFVGVTLSGCTLYVPAESVSAYSTASVWQDFGTKSAIPAPAPAWLRDGDTWDDATKTLTVNSNLVDFAYSNASDIENLVISDAVTSIGQSAFAECTGLTSITIPNNVISIGVGAFCACI